MKQLRNTARRDVLHEKLTTESFQRKTLSFYKYVKIGDPVVLRDELYREWEQLGILGRIYLAHEGINAQISVPLPNLDKFRARLNARPEFADIPWKIGMQEGESFLKLTIKVKPQIVADDLPTGSYDMQKVGKHLSAEDFNHALERGAIVVDMRNHYESRIGHFEGAYCPNVDTFREELRHVREYLRGNEDKKILLYCTGGIRCEKASSYLLKEGFADVNQLHGGIIQYAHEIQERKISSKFKGKNFVFDGRMAERVSEDVLTNCDQCAVACDDYINCRNVVCNLLFIQCAACREKLAGCCSESCKRIASLRPEEQRKIRKKSAQISREKLFRERQRPRLHPSRAAAFLFAAE